MQWGLFLAAFPFSFLSIHYFRIENNLGIPNEVYQIPNLSILIGSIFIFLVIIFYGARRSKNVHLMRGVLLFILFNAVMMHFYLRNGHLFQMAVLNFFLFVAGVFHTIRQIQMSNSIHSKPYELGVSISDDINLESVLTERQLEIAELMLEGLKFKEICNRLFISQSTATKHASNIYARTNCLSKREFIEKYKDSYSAGENTIKK